MNKDYKPWKNYDKWGKAHEFEGKQFILPDGTITKPTHYHQNQLQENGFGSVREESEKGLVRTISDKHGNFNIEVHHELSPAQMSVIKRHIKENRIINSPKDNYHFEVDDYTKGNVVNKQLESTIRHFQPRTFPSDPKWEQEILQNYELARVIYQNLYQD